MVLIKQVRFTVKYPDGARFLLPLACGDEEVEIVKSGSRVRFIAKGLGLVLELSVSTYKTMVIKAGCVCATGLCN